MSWIVSKIQVGSRDLTSTQEHLHAHARMHKHAQFENFQVVENFQVDIQSATSDSIVRFLSVAWRNLLALVDD